MVAQTLKDNGVFSFLLICRFIFVLQKVKLSLSFSWVCRLFTLREARKVVSGRSICVLTWHKTAGFIFIFYSTSFLDYL